MLTKNAMGVAFGGTLSAMTDPFFMLASMHRLGKDYRIWDAAGEIKYLKPGRGTVTADMRIPEETYALIEENTANGEKICIGSMWTSSMRKAMSSPMCDARSITGASSNKQRVRNLYTPADAG